MFGLDLEVLLLHLLVILVHVQRKEKIVFDALKIHRTESFDLYSYE